jgi:diguanylate cyclase (GGDEF)-like protein
MDGSVGVSARGRTFDDAPDDLRGIAARLRSSEYVQLGASPRFRSQQRRRTVAAARVGFLVIAAAAAFDAIALADRDASLGPTLLALNGGVAALAIVGWWLVGGRLARRPDPLAAVITLALAGATVATGILVPALAVESAGYLLLFPVLVTLILPWSTQTHLRWLLAYGAIAFTFLLSSSTNLEPEERGDLVIVELVAMAASVAGHVLLRSAAIRTFSAVRRAERLRRRADAARIELAEVHRVLEETARTDPLTGARNRVRLAEDLLAARGRLGRVGQPVALIALDLDRFKAINDGLGHLAGDAVLKATVEAVRSTLRAEDEVYRFGGEEFLVLLHASDESEARVAAERIRSAVEDLAIVHPANLPGGVVTVSLGVVLIRPVDLDATDDEWFARADAALYRAKDGGRNRVVAGA